MKRQYKIGALSLATSIFMLGSISAFATQMADSEVNVRFSYVDDEDWETPPPVPPEEGDPDEPKPEPELPEDWEEDDGDSPSPELPPVMPGQIGFTHINNLFFNAVVTPGQAVISNALPANWGGTSMNNSVQLFDARMGSLGWEVQVSASDLSLDNNSLGGAQLTFEGIARSGNGIITGASEVTVALDEVANANSFAIAPVGNGSAATMIEFDNVELFIPQNTASTIAGEVRYHATLTWTIINAPDVS